jgi:Ca2+-binding RTX toxin-like protein
MLTNLDTALAADALLKGNVFQYQTSGGVVRLNLNETHPALTHSMDSYEGSIARLVAARALFSAEFPAFGLNSPPSSILHIGAGPNLQGAVPALSNLLRGSGYFDGHERLFGTDGADSLSGRAGDDALYGGPENDLLEGGYGFDLLLGGTGDDTARYFKGREHYLVTKLSDIRYQVKDLGYGFDADGLDFLVSVEFLRFAGTLQSTSIVDALNDGPSVKIDGNANGGNDISFNAPADVLNDIASYVTSQLDRLFISSAGAAQLPSGIEAAYLTGTAGGSLSGNDGANLLVGGSGDDELGGGPGADVLTGNGGNDKFSDTPAGLDGDTITDYERGEQIILKGASFNANAVTLAQGSTVISIDTDGDGTPDSVITLDVDLADLIAAGLVLSVTPVAGGTAIAFVNPGGGAPQAVADAYTLVRGRVASIDATSGVGANDTDPDGDALTFGLLTGPAAGEGSVAMSLDGSFIYIAAPHFVGITQFTYRATDAGGLFSDALVTFIIEERAESLTGTDNAETLSGYGLDDVLDGQGGDDELDGGDGFDTADYSAAPVGITTDLAVSAFVQDGYGFTDTLAGIEAIRGSDGGHDLMLGNDAANAFQGKAGDDRLAGRGGDDLLDGGAGNDLLFAGDDNDTVHGGDGDDRVLGDAGDDVLNGDGGNDIIWAGAGNDEINGGSGDDTLVGEGGDDVILGGDGNDNIRGLDGNDVIDGGTGRDRVSGGNDADTVNGGEDDDRINGDSGDDVLAGDNGNDVLNGDAGNDTLLGGTGNDTQNGGAGQDRIDGGAGLDMLNGGADADTFVLARLQADRDWISGFVSGEDTLEISAALFGGGLAPGALDPSRLVVSNNPVAAQPGVGMFLFDTDDGRLRWDADGSGPGWPPVIATLTGVTTLSSSDFVIV